MDFAAFEFRLLQPVAYFLLSTSAFFLAIQFPHNVRLASAPYILVLAILSLRTSVYLSWIFQGAASFWNLMVCNWIHCSFSVLFIEPFNFPCTPMSKEGWLLAYKIWTDPRHQLDWSTYLQTRNRSTVEKRTFFIFALRRIGKMALCWYIELYIIQPTLVSHFQFRREDFSPEYEPLIRRLSGSPSFTLRELQLRSVISVYWIWLAYLLLDGANILLSLFFVCIVRLDRPEEWRSLFGSISHTSSLRGFWGRFWHRLASPSCAISGRLITRYILHLRPQSGGEKLGIALCTFLVSGLIHAAAEWAADEPVFFWKETQFWLTNFVGATVETLFVSIWRRSSVSRTLGSRRWFKILQKAAGCIWVFTFFFWAAPKWQYPKFSAAFPPEPVDPGFVWHTATPKTDKMVYIPEYIPK